MNLAADWWRLGSAAISALFVATLMAGTMMATFPASIDVSGIGCAGGEVRGLELTVDYRAERPLEVTPHVWGSRSHVQLTWEPSALVLQPGRHRYRIVAPRERGRVGGDRLQVALYDGQRRAMVNTEVVGC